MSLDFYSNDSNLGEMPNISQHNKHIIVLAVAGMMGVFMKISYEHMKQISDNYHGREKSESILYNFFKTVISGFFHGVGIAATGLLLRLNV